ncbi:hypothetical protein B0H14DRAFT_526695 [Mycena olivaceomarginata]|nr:hypothetical protein B0H14DRAFT_526695 [Mycena olivaceomarginata]
MFWKNSQNNSVPPVKSQPRILLSSSPVGPEAPAALVEIKAAKADLVLLQLFQLRIYRGLTGSALTWVVLVVLQKLAEAWGVIEIGLAAIPSMVTWSIIIPQVDSLAMRFGLRLRASRC